jgi:hypothetical protein
MKDRVMAVDAAIQKAVKSGLAVSGRRQIFNPNVPSPIVPVTIK